MRADARDNRARILAAADEVFDRSGPTASTATVAKRAGVGIGTVFRHFPTKPDLLGAVFTSRLERLRDRARELAAASDPDAAFFDFFAEVVAGAASKLALVDALGDTSVPADAARHAGEELREAFGRLLERAQADGTVRPDVDATKAYALMIGASRGTAYASLDDSVRDGMLTVIFDGLRAGSRQTSESTSRGS